MTNHVTVENVEVRNQLHPPATHLAYVIRNAGPASIWVVDDGWLTWRQSGDTLELSYTRGQMQPGARPFGYFVPQVVEVAPGQSLRREVELTWPQPLDRLWNSERAATPAPGRYQAAVRIGYGLTPEADPPTLGESVEAPVLRWQHEAISAPLTLDVPAYQA